MIAYHNTIDLSAYLNVLVTLLYYYRQGSLPDLVYMQIGEQNNVERFIAVHYMMEQVGQNV